MAVHDKGSKAALVARTTTGEQVADALREQIMRGELEPGSALREVSLAEDFGVSRRTLHDAFAVLAAEGLVRHERHKGSKVAQLSGADVADLYKVRMTLELTAARSPRPYSALVLDRLDSAFRDLERAMAGGVAEDVVRCDLGFHRAVVGLIDSPRIDDFFSGIAVEMRYALSIQESRYQESRKRPSAALKEHGAIRDALVQGSVADAEKLIREHIETNRDRLLAVVDRGADTEPG